MFDTLTAFGFSLVHGYGGLFLIISAIMSFALTVRAGRLRRADWMLAVALNIPTLLYFFHGMRGSEVFLVQMYLVLGYGFGGFGAGWVLGILLCVMFWKFRGKGDPGSLGPPA